MRNTHRVAAITGAALVTLVAGAGVAFAGDAQDDRDVCVAGPEQAMINAPVLNCADTDVSDVADVTTTVTDALNDVLDVDDTLNGLLGD